MSQLQEQQRILDPQNREEWRGVFESATSLPSILGLLHSGFDFTRYVDEYIAQVMYFIRLVEEKDFLATHFDGLTPKQVDAIKKKAQQVLHSNVYSSSVEKRNPRMCRMLRDNVEFLRFFFSTYGSLSVLDRERKHVFTSRHQRKDELHWRKSICNAFWQLTYGKSFSVEEQRMMLRQMTIINVIDGRHNSLPMHDVVIKTLEQIALSEDVLALTGEGKRNWFIGREEAVRELRQPRSLAEVIAFGHDLGVNPQKCAEVCLLMKINRHQRSLVQRRWRREKRRKELEQDIQALAH